MNLTAQLGTKTSGTIGMTDAGSAISSRGMFWRLIWIYGVGAMAAVAVVMLLSLPGFEFTARQWLAVAIFGTPAIISYMLVDFCLISRHYRSGQFSVVQTYFKDTLSAHPGDRPSRIFLERCAAFFKLPAAC